VLSAISIKREAGGGDGSDGPAHLQHRAQALEKNAFPKGFMVIGIIRQKKIIIPTGNSVTEPQDRIIIFATREAIPGVEKILAVKLA
jgi:trk system potassium uptake protein TrkA